MKGNNLLLFAEMRRKTLAGKAAWAGLFFILPWIIGAIVFFSYPLLRSLRMSMSEIETLRPFVLKFVGIQWYRDAFFNDITLMPTIMETAFENLINLPLINIFALVAALLLNRKMRARGLFRAMFFLPVLLGTGFVMQQLLGNDISGETAGLLRGLLLPKGLQTYLGPEVTDGIQSFLSRLTEIMWHSGVQILIFLSALQSIQPSVYEAAKIDGAGGWERFWLITLPMLAPMIQMNLVYTLIDTFTMADNKALEFIQKGATSGLEHAYEYSSAVSWIYSLFVLLIVGVLFLMTKRFVENAKEEKA